MLNASAELSRLSQRYTRKNGESDFSSLRKLALEYANLRMVSILDAAAIGLAFDIVFSEKAVDLDKITPEMRIAWSEAYPHIPIESLADRSHEELAGIISGWKGKLFEVEVENRLNNGEWVGDLHLEGDQVAMLADSPTQPGWDLRIVDPDGSVADVIQLKATDSVSYIHEALDHYKDTPILATHEVAQIMADGSAVMDSGILNEHLTNGVSSHISDATSGTLSDGVAISLPISLILVTEAMHVLSGRKNIDQALSSGGDRLAIGAVAAGVATLASVIATPLVGAFAGIVTRFVLGKETNKGPPDINFVAPDIRCMRNCLDSMSNEVRVVGRDYTNELWPSRTVAPNISDQEELYELADPVDRLHILRGAQPLAPWINHMVAKDMQSMSQSELEIHIQQVEEITAQNLVDVAFPAKGAVEKGARLLNNDYTNLKRGLSASVTIGNCLLKKFDGTFTEEDEEEIKLARMTPFKRGRYEQSKDNERRRKLDREEFRSKHGADCPELFNEDGSIRDVSKAEWDAVFRRLLFKKTDGQS